MLDRPWDQHRRKIDVVVMTTVVGGESGLPLLSNAAPGSMPRCCPRNQAGDIHMEGRGGGERPSWRPVLVVMVRDTVESARVHPPPPPPPPPRIPHCSSTTHSNPYVKIAQRHEGAWGACRGHSHGRKGIGWSVSCQGRDVGAGCLRPIYCRPLPLLAATTTAR